MVKQQPENEIGRKARIKLTANGHSSEALKGMNLWLRDALRAEYAPNEDRHLTDAVFDFAKHQTLLVPKAEEKTEAIYREFFKSYARFAPKAESVNLKRVAHVPSNAACLQDDLHDIIPAQPFPGQDA